MQGPRLLTCACALLLLALSACADPSAWLGPDMRQREPDVVYDPTPPELVEAMLELAELRAGDVLYDLGSGDGRIVIAAAQRPGVRAVGIDIDADLVARARENAERAGVAERIEFRVEDLFTAEIGEATVVTLFLGAELNLRLRPRLMEALAPGTRVVSHQYDMGRWLPDRERRIGNRTLYRWTVPPPMSSIRHD
ncbi:MAG: methyltransferase domain-containing protein [Burkholderiales bacterium]|nr:methyltransferase domain-containing protein [Burkholderiales bacterium]